MVPGLNAPWLCSGKTVMPGTQDSIARKGWTMKITQAELDLTKLRAGLPEGWTAWSISTGTASSWCARPPWATEHTIEVQDDQGGWVAALDACWLQHRQREDSGLPLLPRRVPAQRF